MATNTGLKILIICAIGAAIMISGCVEEDTAHTPATVTYHSDTDVVKATPTPRVVSTPTPTPTPPKTGTYKNPTPLGELLISDTGTLGMAVVTVRRGEFINNAVQRENQFNDVPLDGNEYMLVAVGVVYGGDSENSFHLSSRDFKAYANNVECAQPYLVMPAALETTSVDMMPGGDTVAYMVFDVPIGAQVTIAYERLFVSSIYYFDGGVGDFSKEADD